MSENSDLEIKDIFGLYPTEEAMVTLSRVIRDKKVTAVEIDVAIYNPANSTSGLRYSNTFVGTASRNPRDKYNYEVGMQLALSRALKKAAKHLDAVGWGTVKNNDNRQKKIQLNKMNKDNKIEQDAITRGKRRHKKTA